MKNIMNKYSLSFLIVILLAIICYASEAQRLVLNDTQIAYSEHGSGFPEIIFVHGWMGDKSNWNEQIKYFSKHHRVITIDLPGFGESSKSREIYTMKAYGSDVAAILEHLDINDAILVGHSMGSAAVIEAGRAIPEKIKALVVVDVFQDVEEKFDAEKIVYEIDRRKDYIDEYVINNPLDKGILTQTLREYFLWRSNSLLNDLENIDMPIICINSDRRTTKIEIAKKYAKFFKVHIVKNVGHAIMIEKPEEFNRILNNITQKLSD